jgi:hypothetical protein
LVSYQDLLLTSKASPNDWEIVIVIIIDGAKLVLHIGGIIAQTVLLERVTFQPPGLCKEDVMTSLIRETNGGGLMLSVCKLKQGEKPFTLQKALV